MGTKIDFSLHINHLKETGNKTINYMNNMGLNKYVSSTAMKSTLFKSLLQSRIQFGGRSFKPNKSQMNELIKIENNYYKSNGKLFRTSNNVASRMIYGNNSIINDWEINLLKEYYHIVTDLREANSNCWKMFSTYYKMYYKKVYENVLKDEENVTYISKGFLYDVLMTLNKYEMNEFYDINRLPNTYKEWSDMTEKIIKKHNWNLDMKQLKESNNIFLYTLIKMNKIDTYGNKITKLIDKQLKMKSDKIRALTLKILVNKIPLHFKKFKLERCPLCKKKWKYPMYHIFTNCNHLINSNLCITDKRIICLEIITNKIEYIIENNLEEVVKLTTPQMI